MQRHGDRVAQSPRVGEQGHVRGDLLRRLGYLAEVALEGGIRVCGSEAERAAGRGLRAGIGEDRVEVLAQAVEQRCQPLRELIALAARPEKLRREGEPAADERALDAKAGQVPVAAQ